MALLHRDQRGVHDGVQRKMLFAPAQPGGGVVESAKRCQAKGCRVYPELQLLAIPAVQHLQVHGHMVENCNSHTAQVRMTRLAAATRRMHQSPSRQRSY